jgi:hypothetical protein
MLFALAWGNYGYSGTVRLLRHICRTMRRRPGANILECGSGASTILMGILAERYECRVVSLEHSADWAGHMQTLLSRYQLARTQVLHAPLRHHADADYEWYAWPASLSQKVFSVVVCDGPPARTPGGRFGLLPVADSALADDCLILLDDTHRRGERDTIERWRQLRGLRTRSHLALKRFTEIVLLSNRPPTDERPHQALPLEGGVSI